MENPRPEKVAVVKEVRGRLSSANAALLTEYRGLTVDEMANLRKAVRDAGGEYKVYKNTLTRLAVRDLGLDELETLLVGPTAIAFVDGDAVLVAKSLRDFARSHPNLTIKGGLLGTNLLSAEDATALAEVAPRDVLLAQLAGALVAPLRQMAGLLQALPRNFAYGLAALIDTHPAEAAPEPATAEAAPEPGPAEAAAPETDADAAAPEAPAAEAEAPTEAVAPEPPAAEAEAPAEAVAPEPPAAEAEVPAEAVAPEPAAAEAPDTPAAEAEAPAEAAAPEPPAAEAEAPAEAAAPNTPSTDTPQDNATPEGEGA